MISGNNPKQLLKILIRIILSDKKVKLQFGLMICDKKNKN